MRSLQVAMLLLLGFSTANATVYTWKEPDGVLVVTNDEREREQKGDAPVTTYGTVSDAETHAVERTDNESFAAHVLSGEGRERQSIADRSASRPEATREESVEPSAESQSVAPTRHDDSAPGTGVSRAETEKAGEAADRQEARSERASAAGPRSATGARASNVGPAGVTSDSDSGSGAAAAQTAQSGAVRGNRNASEATGAQRGVAASGSMAALATSPDDWLRVDPRELLLTPREPPKVIVSIVGPSAQPLSTARSRLSTSTAASGSSRRKSGAFTSGSSATAGSASMGMGSMR